MYAKTLNWGRLFYPKFMEIDYCRILGRGQEIWAGYCHFYRRSRANQERDAQSENMTAGASTDQNLTSLLEGYEYNELEFLAKTDSETDRGWRSFLVLEIRPHYNPNGSFHHMRFGLLNN
jgi:hypothetical protein